MIDSDAVNDFNFCLCRQEEMNSLQQWRILCRIPRRVSWKGILETHEAYTMIPTMGSP